MVSAQTGFRLSTHIHDQSGTGGLQSALVSKVGEHHDRLCTCHHCPEPRCGASCGQFVRSPELGARNLGRRERHLSEIDSIDIGRPSLLGPLFGVGAPIETNAQLAIVRQADRGTGSDDDEDSEGQCAIPNATRHDGPSGSAGSTGIGAR